MRVNPNSGPLDVNGISNRKALREPRLGHDELALTKAEALSRVLEQTPAVRAQRVAEAKSLVQDTSYPPEVMIRKIATLLAIEMPEPEDSAYRDQP